MRKSVEHRNMKSIVGSSFFFLLAKYTNMRLFATDPSNVIHKLNTPRGICGINILFLSLHKIMAL